MRLVLISLLALSLTSASSEASPLSVRVDGNRLVDGDGKTMRLLGVNRSGFEYACAQGWAITDGPTGPAAIAAMTAWKINAVRIPLNEACWLGLSSVALAYRGQPYRNAVTGFVRRLHSAGLYVILDLHWNAPGTEPALSQRVMPDADHSAAFWSSVAKTFLHDPAIIFDLYNEPYDVSWKCWRSGCTTPRGWKAAGMQTLADAIRSTGATQPIMVSGLAHANDLSDWLTWAPRDPAHALIASFHDYNSNPCATASCWTSTVATVAARVPVVAAEVGEYDCTHRFIDRYIRWANAHGVSYLGWTWNPWDCRLGPALISNWAGTPTPLGAGFRDHLAGP